MAFASFYRIFLWHSITVNKFVVQHAYAVLILIILNGEINRSKLIHSHIEITRQIIQYTLLVISMRLLFGYVNKLGYP